MDPRHHPVDPGAPASALPPRLEGLRRLAYNLYWAWHPRTRDALQPDRPARRGRATAIPIPVLSGPIDWSRLLDDANFMAEYHDVLRRLRPLHGQRRRPLVRTATTPTSSTGPIAYFCAEYGLHESLGIYSGGLGVLAGDH